MPAYRWPIPPADRWAIIAHVRELQRERQARAASAPAAADRSGGPARLRDSSGGPARGEPLMEAAG